jgi:uncharacterized protein YjgD (DUF1641 family)
MEPSSIKQALEILKIDLNSIDPTISKLYDAKTLETSAGNLDAKCSFFYNKLVLQKQINPLISDSLLAAAKILKEDNTILTKILKSPDPKVYQPQWIKLMSDIGSIESIMKTQDSD